MIYKQPCFKQNRDFKNLNNPYVVIFYLWNDRVIRQISDYPTLDEALEEAKLLNVYYNDTPRPIKIKDNYSTRIIKIDTYDYSNGGKFWGYIVLDYNKNEIVKVGHDGVKGYGKKITPEMKDYFLRDANEIPEDYTFDDGEYEGWLQYRWGDGKNAVDYVEPDKPKKKKVQEFGMDFETMGLPEFPTPDDYNIELIETTFDNLINKETKTKLMEKYGW